jgi:hypothetical protein
VAQPPVELALSRLSGTKPCSGGGWMAKCPAHEDSTQSLKVDEAPDDERLLLKCHAGCGFADIMSAMGLEQRDAFVRPNGTNSRTRKQIAWYDYVDEQGDLLFQVVRFEPKDFRQRRPLPDGGWGWKLGKTRRVLYRLPAVVAAVEKGRAVLVVEGEKDVHALESLGGRGFVATTNPGGGGKWTKGYTKSLKGAVVALLPDADPTGRRHAHDVARQLLGVAATVRVLELPNLSPKGDVSDWIAAGGSADDLKRLITQTPVATEASLAAIVGEFVGAPATDPGPRAELPGSFPVVQLDHDQPLVRQRAADVVHDANRGRIANAEKHGIRPGDRRLLFARGGCVVALTSAGDAPSLSAVSLDAMQDLLAATASWVKDPGGRSKKPVQTIAPSWVGKGMLVSPDPRFDPLEAVVGVPVFAPNGDLVTQAGHHRGARVWHHPTVEVPAVPQSPDGDDVRCARDLICDDLLGDFPFSGEADTANAVAALLLPFVRRLISGPTPLHLVEAPKAGTGKGLFASLVSILALGRETAPMTLPRDDDEIRKTITAELQRALPVVVLDNIPAQRRVDSPALAAVLTTSSWTARRLGSTSMITVPNRAVWIATANNPQLSDELARRCVDIRIDARIARPEERDDFVHPDLKAWAGANRNALVHALLVLGRAWVEKGMPRGTTPFGSFESWAAVIGGILDVAGLPGFLENRERLRHKADTETKEWTRLFALWWIDAPTAKGCSSWKTAGELVSMCSDNDLLMRMRGDRSEHSQKIRLSTNGLIPLEGTTFAVEAGGRILAVRLVHRDHKKRFLWRLETAETAGKVGLQ